MTLIFEKSTVERSLPPSDQEVAIPPHLLRQTPPGLPMVSELEAVRHYTGLSRKDYSIDTHFYPLGSCTMKYNPRICHKVVSERNFLSRHPLAPDETGQGVLSCLYELQEMLKEITGMQGVSLAPMAGAQGEFAGVAMIRAWHNARGDVGRKEILVPDAAHGTNPATAAMCGYTVREIPTNADGDVDLAALQGAVGPQTAGLMLTNPSTLGVFERNVTEIARVVHGAGGLLYYDGANLNAILGRVRPGEMGFDVVHVNLHKSFATPHGGGGPGSGPVAVGERLLPFLPLPVVAREGERYRWLSEEDLPSSMGRLSAFAGNVGVALRAYAYILRVGQQGLRRISGHAALNANYLMARLTAAGFEAAFPGRLATHEFILTLRALKKEHGVSALDVAKRMLDHGFYAPTIYFPLMVAECMLIEPAESESKADLDRLVAAMTEILAEARETPERVREAPHTLPVRRLDEAKAARDPDLVLAQA